MFANKGEAQLMATVIDTATLNQLLLDAFSGKMTWLEASKKHTLDDLIETLFKTRALTEKTITGLTDAQVSVVVQSTPIWSISEMITHLIYSQNFYYNQLLDITTSQLPHLLEAAQGFGEGAVIGKSADELLTELRQATERLTSVITQTRDNHVPDKITDTGPKFFGRVDYQTWILLLLGHEVDHVRQGIIMRRMVRGGMETTTAKAVTGELSALPTAENAISPEAPPTINLMVPTEAALNAVETTPATTPTPVPSAEPKIEASDSAPTVGSPPDKKPEM